MNKLEKIYAEESEVEMFGLPLEMFVKDTKWSESIILSGSYNPLTIAHLSILHYIEKLRKMPLSELSINNCDKGNILYIQCRDRIEQFRRLCRPILITRSPHFIQKSVLFPGATFAVGTDTIERLGNLKYYYGSKEEMEDQILSIGGQKCSFLVFERNGQKLSEMTLPDSLRKLCTLANWEPMDVSSTKIREKEKGKS